MSVSNINSAYLNIEKEKLNPLRSASYDRGFTSISDKSIFETDSIKCNSFTGNECDKFSSLSFNNTKETEISSSLTSRLYEIKDEQGLLGKAWDGFKNLTGIGASSNKAEMAIEQYENGEISYEEAQKILEKYEDGQNMVVDVIGDMTSGIVAVGAAMAAPFTGGASLLFAGAIGAAVKVGIKGTDSIIGGKKYGLKEIGYDLITGSINGAMAPLTNALGGAAGTGIAKVCGLNVAKSAASEGVEAAGKSLLTRLLAKQGAEYVLKEGVEATLKTTIAKVAAYGVDMAIDGAVSGATDGFARSLASGDFDNMDDNIKQGFFGGLITAPIIGGGFKLAGKAGSAIGKKLGSTNLDTPDLNLKNLELDLEGDGLSLNNYLTADIRNSADFNARANKFSADFKELQNNLKTGEISKADGNRKFFELISELTNDNTLSELANDSEIDLVYLSNAFNLSRATSSLEALKDANTADIFKQILKLNNKSVNPFECAVAYSGLDSSSKEIYTTLLEMAQKGDIDASVLRGWKDSIIDPKFAQKVLTYNKAIQDGLSDVEIKDLFIPRTSSLEEGLSKVAVGDLFDYDGKLLIKLSDGAYEELKISRDTYFNLFPFVDHFSQGKASDCYCLSAISSMLDDPNGKAVLLKCFEETADGKLSVSLPDGKIQLTTDLSGTLPSDKLKFESRYAAGSKGVKLLEAALGDELTYKRTSVVIEKLEALLSSGKMNENQRKLAEDILDSLSQSPDAAPKYVLTETPRQALNQRGIQTPIVIGAGEAGNLKNLALVCFEDLKKATELFGETSEIYYRANSGNPVEVFNMFGFKGFNDNGIEQKCKVILDCTPDELANPKKHLFTVSVADKTGTIKGTESVLNFDLGMLNNHSYSLSIKEGPVENLYILRNPYNSSRQIVLSESEYLKYVKSVGIAEK